MLPNESAATCDEIEARLSIEARLARLRPYHVSSCIMLSICRMPAIAIALCLTLGWPSSPRADIQQEAAASYIRTLFDTSLRPGAEAAAICPDVASFGRFAAGHAWHGLPDDERARFAEAFCALAIDAVARLHAAYPGLRLDLEQISPGAQGMVVVESLVTRPALEPWPVKWVVAADSSRLRLADLRVLGISLGIFLRGLAALQPAPDALHPATAARILAPWRRALDRAFPPASGAP